VGRFKLIPFFLITALLAVMLISCGTIQVAGGGTLTVGTLVDENDSAVVGATVSLYKADDNTVIKTATTDGKGNFKFDSLPANVKYTYVGVTADGSKKVFKGPFVRAYYDSITDLKKDTVYLPGAIQGCVTYPLVADLKSDVTVYIPGTSFSAIVNKTTPFFTMSSVPKGVYTLRFTGANLSLTTSGILVVQGDTTIMSNCFALENDTIGAPPSPVVDTILLLDPVPGIVQIKWKHVEVADRKGYEIYRFDSLNTVPTLICITSDNYYNDDVYRSGSLDTLPRYYYYQIKTIDELNNPSTYSSIMSIKLYPPSFYKTRVNLSIKNKRGNDTITNADTVVAVVSYYNGKLAPANVRWSEGSLGNVIKVKSIHSSMKADSSWYGIDTLLYVWSVPGKKTLFVEVDDCQGFGNWYADTILVDVLDNKLLNPHDVWKPMADPLAVGKMFSSAVVVDTVLYVIGGQKLVYISTSMVNRSEAVKTVERFNIKNGTKMDNGVDLPNKSSYHSAAVVDKTIFVFGGSDIQTAYSSIYYIKQGDTKWTKCADSLPFGLIGMACAVYDSKIYLFGGSDPTSVDEAKIALNDIFVFDTKTLKIAKAGQMQKHRTNHQAVTIGQKIWVLGGVDEMQTSHTDIEIYDPVSKISTTGPLMPETRNTFSACAVGDSIYIFGGKNSMSGNVIGYDNVKVLNCNRTIDGWLNVAPVGYTISGDAAVCHNRVIYSAGGSNTASGVSEVLYKRVMVYYP
jgi:N-acetylneuraminic acid mutarotase